MKTLIIDIRENSLRALFCNDGLFEYCRTFTFEPAGHTQVDGAVNGQQLVNGPASDNPYLMYYDADQKRNPWDQALKEIVKRIRSEINNSIDETHLIIPSEDVVMATHQLPKMPKLDAEKLISRKIKSESKEEFPPFAIIPAAADHKTQTWHSLYVPTPVLQDYRKTFAANRLRLSSITTPVNAIIDAFRGVNEAIFNSYAVFEIQHGFVEAYYITNDGLLFFQRLPYKVDLNSQEGHQEEIEKSQKFKLFKIIDTIFRINSQYQANYPKIPVQMAWVCGLEHGLNGIATALNEAMGIEVGIAPVMPGNLADESGYVPLTGFATALHNGIAVSYSTADFFKRFPLRKTSGLAIYAVTSLAALLAFSITEREYRNLNNQVKQLQQQQQIQKLSSSKNPVSAAYSKNLETLRKLTAHQFIFYNLFRELANDLPDGVFLENLEFHLKDETALVDITASARLNSKIGENMLLSRLMAMFDRSPVLKNHQEPSITVVDRDKERYLKITVTSEVNPLDKTK